MILGLNFFFSYFRSNVKTDTMKVGLNDLADTLNEVVDDNQPTSESPPISVTEKVIFCVDKFLLINNVNGMPLGTEIFNMLRSYFFLKKKLNVKPVEFELFIIINNDNIMSYSINSQKDILTALESLKYVEKTEETEPFDFDKLFTELAVKLPLPDPSSCSESLPPPFVYHAILLFGHNKFVPIMGDTNAFDYFMMTPYFALDVLYVYDNNPKKNQCEQISEALACLNENNKGYYFSAYKGDINEQYSAFTRFLGHPLIRFPQNKVKFNIEQLGPANDDDNADH